jgi:hypothetical protein
MAEEKEKQDKEEDRQRKSFLPRAEEVGGPRRSHPCPCRRRWVAAWSYLGKSGGDGGERGHLAGKSRETRKNTGARSSIPLESFIVNLMESPLQPKGT